MGKCARNEARTNPLWQKLNQVPQLDKLFERMLPAIVKIVKPSVSKFSGNTLEYSKFKAAFRVEVDKREVYDATEKLKFFFRCCGRKCKIRVWRNFIPGSDRYEKAWTALGERFGRVDTVVLAAKKRVDQ